MRQVTKSLKYPGLQCLIETDIKIHLLYREFQSYLDFIQCILQKTAIKSKRKHFCVP